jgi:hypothetical protein
MPSFAVNREEAKHGSQLSKVNHMSRAPKAPPQPSAALVPAKSGPGGGGRVNSVETSNHTWKQQTRATSRFRGVCWHKGCGKWSAQIQQGMKRVRLGMFLDDETAAREYDKAAWRLLGAAAFLNFPQDDPELHVSQANWTGSGAEQAKMYGEGAPPATKGGTAG